jgi:hypothetical protein
VDARLVIDQCWNGAPAPSGLRVSATLAIHGSHLTLAWDVALAGPPRVPDEPPGWLDGLWGWDVLELFVRGAARERYVELEFGPAGHWLALSFDGVRRRSAELADLPVAVSNDVAGTRWRGRAVLPVSAIERHVGPRPWSGLVAAALGGGPAGERVHLASAILPGAQPDFHQPDAWPSL